MSNKTEGMRKKLLIQDAKVAKYRRDTHEELTKRAAMFTDLYKSGTSFADMARWVGCAPSTVARAVHAYMSS